MDHYQDIQVLPDPEFTQETLMAALFAKLHRALGARGKGDIGVSFPDVGIKPGARLRLHGLQPALAGGFAGLLPEQRDITRATGSGLAHRDARTGEK